MENVIRYDMAKTSVRELNHFLHTEAKKGARVEILNSEGRHNLAVGLDAEIDVDIRGHAGALAPVHRRRRFLPGSQRLAVQPVQPATPLGKARHWFRNRQ